MTDLFEEVEGELRREQYARTVRRVAPWAIGLLVGVLLIGGGIAGYSYWKDRRAENASASYDAALQSLSQGNPDAAFNAFGEVAADAPAIYRFMALNHQGAIRLQQGRREDAVALWDMAAEAAPKTEAGLLVADFTRLKSVWVLIDQAPYDEIEGRLLPMSASGRPYSANAKFTLGLAKLKAGMAEQARADFLSLSTSLDAQPALTQAAQVAVDLIDSGGGVDTISEVVAAVAALPPPQAPGGDFQITPEMLEQMMRQQGAPAQ